MSVVALALENARQYETEHDIADRLQEALLLLPEELPGIEFAHEYHSATESTRVGGDFYDIFELDEDHVGITIGDVAGKGIDAAVLTSIAKHTIRAYAVEPGRTPGCVLSLTNNVVYRATPVESFLTVFFGILDRRDGALVYASASHTIGAITKGDGTIVKLGPTGTLLGAFDGIQFKQAEVLLERDEILFLYTDGLTESRSEGELYGDQRLFALLATMGESSTSEVVRAVVRDVISFAQNHLRDDLAILAVRRRDDGPGASA
jgi:serine phosphatase RsbU (regulator of sigma subunit)